MNARHTIPFLVALLLAPLARSGAAEDKPAEAFAKYPGWQHSGSLYILTTPEGANLPATASEDGFPLLVRLDKDWFDFSQAKANGEDIRFATGTGTPLAYEIDAWDAAKGTASIWVRIAHDQGQRAPGTQDVSGARPMPRASPADRRCSMSPTAISASGTWTIR